MSRAIRTIGTVSESGSSEDLLAIVESTISGLSKDIDRYYFKEREFHNFRFMVTFSVFGIYVATALLTLSVAFTENGVTLSEFIAGKQSAIGWVGILIILAGIPIVFNQLARAREAIRTLTSIKRHLNYQLDYAEEALKRVTDWESQISSRDFYRPILRLRIAMLVQLIEELRIIASRTTRMKLFGF